MTPFEGAVRSSLEGSRDGRVFVDVHADEDHGYRATPLSGTQLSAGGWSRAKGMPFAWAPEEGTTQVATEQCRRLDQLEAPLVRHYALVPRRRASSRRVSFPSDAGCPSAVTPSASNPIAVSTLVKLIQHLGLSPHVKHGVGVVSRSGRHGAPFRAVQVDHLSANQRPAGWFALMKFKQGQPAFLLCRGHCRQDRSEERRVGKECRGGRAGRDVREK